MRKALLNSVQKLYQWMKSLAVHFLYDVNIRKKFNAVGIIIVIMPVIILGISLYTISKNNIIDTENESVVQTARQLTDVLDFYLETVISKSDIIYRNYDLQERLTKNYSDDLSGAIDSYNNIARNLSPLIFEIKYPNMKYSRFSNKISDKILITIYSTNDTLNFMDKKGVDNVCIKDFRGLGKEMWYTEMKSSGNSFFWRPTYQDTYRDTLVNYISFNRAFINLKTGETIGILSIEIPEECLSEVLKSKVHGEQWFFYLLSQDNGVVFKNMNSDSSRYINDQVLSQFDASDKEGFMNQSLKVDGYRVYYTTSNVSNWKLIVGVSNQAMLEKIKWITIVAVTICVFSMTVAILLMMLMSKTITHRIRLLTDKANSVGDNTLVPLKEIKGKDEVGELDRQFNSMVRKINDLVEKEYKVRLNMKIFEAELLHEQLNPHLLYNSMTAIRWIAKRNNIQNICDITNSLIGFYKASLNKGSLFNRVSNEIGIIDEYVSLNCTVYHLNLEYRKEVDESIFDYYCIKLILQPIVENAILHGLRKNDKHGRLVIRGRILEQRIVFEVQDNGTGMSEETIAAVLDESSSDKAGFGVYNVQRKIKLIYGNEYGISIKSEPGKGTRVCITVPCLEKEDIDRMREENGIL